MVLVSVCELESPAVPWIRQKRKKIWNTTDETFSLTISFARFRFVCFWKATNPQCFPRKKERDWNEIRDIESKRGKMAASLRVLAKGKLSTMQPALRAIITRTSPMVLSRGISVTSELNLRFLWYIFWWEMKDKELNRLGLAKPGGHIALLRYWSVFFLKKVNWWHSQYN